FGYDLATVQMLFRSYGEAGRSLYLCNLLVDTPFPIFGATATILFVFLAFDRQSARTSLVIPPIVFAITDLIENILIVFMLQRYPYLSPSFVSSVSLVTQVKRAAFYLTAGILPISLIVAIIKAVMQGDTIASGG
ncbi:MAG: hypothetical protein GWN58_56410, partial [Anaerolineae bacterium]|nr:hypothetical protein [Anaerolineae bacterium]